MKKQSLAVGAAALMLFGATQAYAQGTWIVKASGDYFDINTDSDTPVAGISGGTDVKGTTELDGEMTGGTFYLGKMYGPPESLKVTMLEVSIRQGDFDITSQVTDSWGGSYGVLGEMDRKDFELKLSQTWVKGKWQPYVSIGYWNIDEESTQVLQDDYYWIAQNDPSRMVEKNIDAFLANIGFGVSLYKNGGFNLAFKGEAGINYGKADFTVIDASHLDADDSSVGWQGKANLTFAYSFPMGANTGQAFFDAGYQYQGFDFGEEVGEESFYGPYGRLGFSVLF